MHSFPEPALALVRQMTLAAAADPARAMALQGAPGCNGHRAALEYDADCLPLPCFSFEDALDAVKDGTAARAIIPIENSQHGRVADIHFLLPESGLSIIGEHFLSIHHALMGLTAGPFTAAFSHPQALGQSRHYLRSKGIVPMAYADTAAAAAFIKEQGDTQACAIAPKIAADLYGLQVVEENVEDSDDNTTRTNGVNMTKLESYQVGASFAATTFFCDIEGAPGDAAVDRAIEELAFHCKYVRMLGTYPQARARG
jgi:prephenate dehydratase